MARHDYQIANATGASVRADLNNALAAIQSVNSGSGAPSSTVAYQYFIDDSATPALIKQRNAADNGNILLGEVGGQSYFSDGSQSKPSISFRNDTDLGLRRNDTNKLSIVTNGTDRVTVDASGNVGIKTDAPTADLHIESAGDSVLQLTAGASNRCLVRFGDTADTNIGKIEYDNNTDSLAFDTNNITRLTILSDGKCGIGETTPTELLHVAGNIKTTGNIDIASGNITNGSPAIGTSGFELRDDSVHKLGRNTADALAVLQVFGGSGEAKVKGNGDLQNTNNSYGSLSDSKLKENIVDANSQWDDIKGVRVRNYNFKSSTGYGTHTQIGVIAQELEAVSPGLVKESNDEDADGNSLGTTTKTVSYSVLYMKAVKALQEAMDRIETLEAKVAALEAGN
jgi:hypothetical protein